jgi:hypothetical protein
MDHGGERIAAVDGARVLVVDFQRLTGDTYARGVASVDAVAGVLVRVALSALRQRLEDASSGRFVAAVARADIAVVAATELTQRRGLERLERASRFDHRSAGEDEDAQP